MNRLIRIFRIFKVVVRRGLKIFFGAAAIYLLFVVVGLTPVNNGFIQPEDGIEIFVVSNSVHSDIIVPRTTSSFDWSTEFAAKDFGKHSLGETHVAFGWGDRAFYLETETWQDLEIGVASNALFLPSSCCIHVAFTRPEYHLHTRSIRISEKQYSKLVDFLLRSFRKNGEEKKHRIEGYAYSDNDAFYEATGSYHLFNTCNSWVGRGLHSAGVKTPFFTPLPGLPTLYLDSSPVE